MFTFCEFEGIKNHIATRYFALAQNLLPNMLNDIRIPICRFIRFQNDGTPVHFSRLVRTNLHANFRGY